MLEVVTAIQPREGLPRRVGVAVLGELGRSPRMLYHALSLAVAGAEVQLIGEAGSALPAALASARAVTVDLMRPPLRPRGRRGPTWGALAATQRTLRLGAALRRMPRVETLLVQVPPAFPTLLVARRACRQTGARLVVDWHNLAAPLAALRLGPRQPLVRWLASHELREGARADAHLCVSSVMAAELASHGIRTTVFRDRPAERFRPTAPAEARALAGRLGAAVPELGNEAPSRAALVVCPCGYTDDDDFDVLLGAVPSLEGRLAARGPRVLVLLTGEGPRRREVEARLAGLALERVSVRTAWLEPDDYPVMLGAADLGLSLHRSASGLDLPMKVADMLGSGLPVCALGYPCLAEQLCDGTDSVLFTAADALSHALAELLDGFPNAPRLAALRSGALGARRPSWESAWREHCRAVILPEAPP